MVNESAFILKDSLLYLMVFKVRNAIFSDLREKDF